MGIFGPATATAVTVTSSGPEIYTPTAGGTAQNVTVVNTGATACFIGQSAVTATTGTKLAPGAQLTIEGTEEALYAVVASGSATTTVLSGLATVASVV